MKFLRWLKVLVGQAWCWISGGHVLSEIKVDQRRHELNELVTAHRRCLRCSRYWYVTIAVSMTQRKYGPANLVALVSEEAVSALRRAT